ncbi:hypothetical protein C5Y97_01115 [Blastopirellula marina]|uniref:Uncharacterized protein n=1 Tax=Blastopirellula marina TaxID=124 RepID=A0A2S8GFD5_9BACT|nr:hypothetical protein C5Y98_01115 [Blastopirellula marina]PTL46550.1 hypothetical protein C5Y97_01115 [Blastopirellula marina]
MQITCLENDSWSESGYEEHWPKNRVGRSVGMCGNVYHRRPGKGKLGIVGIERRFQWWIKRRLEWGIQWILLERQQRFEQWLVRFQR